MVVDYARQRLAQKRGGDLHRVTDSAGRIADLDFTHLRQVRVGGREGIPTLEELLDAFPGALFNIDLKTDRAVPLLAEILERRGDTSRVLVGSFSRRRLRRFRRMLPGVATSATSAEVAAMAMGLVRRRRREIAFQVPITHTFGPFTVRLVTRRSIRAVHRAGRRIHVWTIDEPETMHHLIDKGVDGIITDRPDLLKAVLSTRGMWSTRQGT